MVVAGPGSEIVRGRLLNSRFQSWIWRIDHSGERYAKMLAQLGRGDLFVMLVCGEDGHRVPPAYHHMAPLSAEELELRLRRGETVAEGVVLATGLEVVLLAAQHMRDLEELAGTYPFQ